MGPGPQLNKTFASQGTTVFTVMSALAVEHGAINLGQGFPDVDGPEEVRKLAAQHLIDGPNQYPPMMGVAELRQVVADHNKRFYGLDYDWQTEVIVTSGATEALEDCFMALLNPGDEAIVIEPFYDCYLPQIEQTGATVKAVALEPLDWSLPAERLEAAFSDKTKLIVLNTPMNPASKVFTRGRAPGHCRPPGEVRRLCGVRRGLRASDVRRPQPRTPGGAAGHARALPEDRVGRQDLFAHRLEGRGTSPDLKR